METLGLVAVKWKNIDKRLTCTDLKSFLELLGFGDAYKDVYVVFVGPGESTGIAVVEFHTVPVARTFQTLVHGKIGRVFGNASAPCIVEIDGVTVSKKQGVEVASPFGNFKEISSKPEPRSVPPESPTGDGGAARLGGRAEARPAPSQPRKPHNKIPASNASDKQAASRQVAAAPVPWPPGITTAMIRNIACRFTQDDVAEVLDSLGFSGRYDGVRVPRRPMMQSNVGYAFVQFSTSEDAELCQRMCHGRNFGHSYSTKLCEIVPAHIQGVISLGAKAQKFAAKREAEEAAGLGYFYRSLGAIEPPRPSPSPKHAENVGALWISV